MVSISSYRKSGDLLKKLTNIPPLINAYIKENPNLTVLEGPILQYRMEKGKPRKRYLFLIDRVLVICKVHGTKFTIHHCIGLNSRKDIAIVTDSQYKIPDVEFRVYGRWTYILFAQSTQERDRWVQEMQKYLSIHI